MKKRLDNIIDRGMRKTFSRRFALRGYGKGGRRPRHYLLTAVTVLAAMTLAGLVTAAVTFAWLAKDLPDPNNIKFQNPPQTTRIFDRTGEIVLYEIHGDQKRTVVGLDRISPHLINATIAAEDRNFYVHNGFSVKGFLRALLKNTLNRTIRGEGGSTITQQLVKLSMLTKEKTYTRKAKELVLSIEMERRFTKDEILKMYLNEIPYGSVIYGIESASQSYFGKPSLDLTLSEAALLASIPKASTYYAPFGNHRKELVDRSHFVIETMVELGMATRDEADGAKSDDVLSRLQPRIDNIIAPHFVFLVREILAEKFGDQAESGGLKVITTLDAGMQEKAERAILDNMENIEKWGGSNAALMAMNPKNGEVMAMVGSADYFDDEHNGKFNHIFGYLQPGSSIKPIVYAAAFERGYTPDTVLYDVDTEFSTEYRPSNYDGLERGPVTIRQALAGSLNIPAVKALYLVGMRAFAEYSERFGYTTLNDPGRLGLSLVLGGGEVYPFEHINAFSVFPQDGEFRPAKLIVRVEDTDGKTVLDDSETVPARRVVSAQTARQITSILSDNASRAYIFGENNHLTLGNRPVAAKTGTTNRFKDAWTVGYTPSLLSGVWVGNSNGTEMKPGADSSRVAAPIWNVFMKTALEGTPIEAFVPPEPTVTGKPVLDGQPSTSMTVRIDKVSGKLATENTPEDMVEEMEFSSPHSILHFVDRGDPRGEPPADPSVDPQYYRWEEGVTAWAEREGITLRPPPTEKDDVHTPENTPTVSITAPQNGSTWTDRQVYLSVQASAPRGIRSVEYLLDGEVMATFDSSPFGGLATVPNRFGKGYRQLTAKAYDDVGNRNESRAITINLVADPGPIGIYWLNLNQNSRLHSSDFPYPITIRLDEHRAISEFSLSAVSNGSGTVEMIGTVRNPALPNLTFTWKRPPTQSGTYRITAKITLNDGTVQMQEMSVWVTN
ncbi:transglycosylase domain-containing protein [Candidatus Uhrbacteria bacterium]|nr:transglycosylase domain-containing protein [Candidatus Uhrbacteria bacterium]